MRHVEFGTLKNTGEFVSFGDSCIRKKKHCFRNDAINNEVSFTVITNRSRKKINQRRNNKAH